MIYYNTKIQKKKEKSIKGKSVWGRALRKPGAKLAGVSSQSSHTRCTKFVQLRWVGSVSTRDAQRLRALGLDQGLVP